MVSHAQFGCSFPCKQAVPNPFHRPTENPEKRHSDTDLLPSPAAQVQGLSSGWLRAQIQGLKARLAEGGKGESQGCNHWRSPYLPLCRRCCQLLLLGDVL